MKVVVGLGNYPVAYKHTRHNAGYMVVDAVAEKWSGLFKKKAVLRPSVPPLP